MQFAQIDYSILPSRRSVIRLPPLGGSCMFASRRTRRRHRITTLNKRRINLEPLETRLVLATVTVTTADDSFDIPFGGTIADLPGPDGVVSLREAIIATDTTPGADEIVFDTDGVFAEPQTIELERGSQDIPKYLRITDDLVIDGIGPEMIVVKYRDRAYDRPLMVVDDGVDDSLSAVRLVGLTIRSGSFDSGILKSRGTRS